MRLFSVIFKHSVLCLLNFRLVYVSTGLELYDGYNAFPYNLDATGHGAEFDHCNQGSWSNVWLMLQKKPGWEKWKWEISGYQCYQWDPKSQYSYFICQDERRKK